MKSAGWSFIDRHSAAVKETNRACLNAPIFLGTQIAFLVTFVGVGALLQAQQDMVLVSNDQSRPPVRWSGHIVDFTGRELILERSPGRVQRLDPLEILEFHTAWPETYRRATERAAAGDWSAALASWRQALDQELRPWAKRLVVLRMVRAHYELGQFDAAGELFAALVEQDPYPPYFADWPIPWGENPRIAPLERKAMTWTQGRFAAVRLLGAAWLIGTDRHSHAQSVLAELTNDAHLTVRTWAQCQLWRSTSIHTSSRVDRDQCEALIRELPESLQAGPYFVLGQLCQEESDPQGAMLAYLRVAIVHADRQRLASEALWRAAVELQKTNPQQAAVLYAEFAKKFSQTALAEEARRRAAALGHSTPP